MGLFMVIISPDSLRLTAIYGFASGSAVLLLGAVVGDWIDRTPRLSGTLYTRTPYTRGYHILAEMTSKPNDTVLLI